MFFAVDSSDRKFIYAKVGINGAVLDRGVFSHFKLREMITNGQLNLPADKVFVGDSAFPLRTNLMKPFGFRNLDEKRFNNNLSTTRVVVEHVIGILTT